MTEYSTVCKGEQNNDDNEITRDRRSIQKYTVSVTEHKSTSTSIEVAMTE